MLELEVISCLINYCQLQGIQLVPLVCWRQPTTTQTEMWISRFGEISMQQMWRAVLTFDRKVQQQYLVAIKLIFSNSIFLHDDVTNYFQNLAERGGYSVIQQNGDKISMAKKFLVPFAVFTSSYTILNKNHKTNINVISKCYWQILMISYRKVTTLNKE